GGGERSLCQKERNCTLTWINRPHAECTCTCTCYHPTMKHFMGERAGERQKEREREREEGELTRL
ncbi:MAG: hypothetical protein MJE68_14380, partial [Proteobacteria bacterium]|nr:hypothetical protein [Pseudomonadota bacterium]